ncbi:MAG: ABC transporter permease [Chthonomonadales bacterium]
MSILPAERRRMSLPVETGVAVVLVVLALWLGWRFPDFRSPGNLAAVLGSSAEIGIVAAGMTLVIATGGIDISVGSVVGLCGIVIGMLCVNMGWNVWLACGAGLAVGALCGFINGALVAGFGLPPIIATLASYSAARGAAYVLSNGASISGLPDAIIAIGYGSWLGIPTPAWIAAAALVTVGAIVRFSTFGRAVKALGGNREASRLSGLAVRRTELMTYVVSGLLAGLSAIVVTARGATAIPDAGRFFEMRAITAVVVGGTSVAGGRATIIGTILGVLTIGVVANGVRDYGKAGIWEELVLGMVLLAAVEVDRWRTRRNRAASV